MILLADELLSRTRGYQIRESAHFHEHLRSENSLKCGVVLKSSETPTQKKNLVKFKIGQCASKSRCPHENERKGIRKAKAASQSAVVTPAAARFELGNDIVDSKIWRRWHGR